MCVCSHQSVPTSCFTDCDQRQPGCSSNRPTTPSPTFAMSSLPLSNFRVSSGEFRLLLASFCPVAVPSATASSSVETRVDSALAKLEPYDTRCQANRSLSSLLNG